MVAVSGIPVEFTRIIGAHQKGRCLRIGDAWFGQSKTRLGGMGGSVVFVVSQTRKVRLTISIHTSKAVWTISLTSSGSAGTATKPNQ